MEQLPKPSSIVVEPLAEHRANIVISPCYPGYGTTLGNALRRVLLSSLPGAAITAIKLKGVDHEFSTIPSAKQDVVEIILNLKGLRLKLHSEEPQEIQLVVKGEKKVTAADFEKNSMVEIANPDLFIVELTDPKAELDLRVRLGAGRGYVPVENREKEKLDIGYIAVDSIYTPVRTVNFTTKHVRVGQMTNFDQLNLDILTDGTITPEDAFQQAANVLVDQFTFLAKGPTPKEPVTQATEMTGEVKAPEAEAPQPEEQS